MTPRQKLRWWGRQRKGGLFCHYCGKEVFRCVPRGSHDRATMDHVKPKAVGGPANSVTNLVVACEPCNRDKGSIDIGRWHAHPI